MFWSSTMVYRARYILDTLTVLTTFTNDMTDSIWENDTFDEYGLTKFDHVRVFDRFDDYAYELYYHELIQGQPFSAGFMPIYGHGHYDGRYVIAYRGQLIPEDARQRLSHESYSDVIEALKQLFLRWLVVVDADESQLFWDPDTKKVRLAHYRLLDLHQPDTFPYHLTDRDVRRYFQGKPVKDLNDFTLLSFLQGRSVVNVYISPEDIVEQPFHEPPVDLATYRQLLLTAYQQDEHVLQEGNQTDARVVIPPVSCTSLKLFPEYSSVIQPQGGFVGKVCRSHYECREELVNDSLATLFDPAGQYHSRLLKVCNVQGSAGIQLIHEYTGLNLTSIGDYLTMDNRWWFYRGLLNLMNGLQLFHDHRLYHLDIKPENITWTPFFHLRLIDFASADTEVFQLDPSSLHDWHYVAQPIERMLLTDDYDWELLAEKQRDLQFRFVGDLRGKFLMMVNHQEDYQTFIDDLKKLRRDQLKLVVSEYVDLYGLGISLLTSLPINILRELKPVVYHLVAIDVVQRRLNLARQRLVDLLDQLR